jgi:leucyl-tRNA synthetase
MAALLRTLVLLLAPFAPYAAEELWTLLGHAGPVFKQAWPKWDETLAKEAALEIPVQVNGKLRGKVTVAHGTAQAAIQAAALAEAKVRPHIAGKQVVKVIVVGGKLVNIVAR